MTRIGVVFLTGLLTSAPPVLQGQDGVPRVTLAEALDAFAENSLALRIARAEAAEIAGRARQSRSYANPAISLLREDLSRSGDDYWETTAGLMQRIEWPGRTAARGVAARHTITGAGARFRADSLQLVFVVREAYVGAWLAEEAEQTIGQAAEMIQVVTRAAEQRLEAGDISGYETRRLRLGRIQAEKDEADAELRARAARRLLASLVLPAVSLHELGPADAIVGIPPAIASGAALDALARRPDLEAAARELDAARAEHRVANLGWVPDPTLNLAYKEHADGFKGATVGVDLPLPIFNRAGGARDEAAARESAALSSLDLLRRQAELDLVDASDRYSVARERLEVTGEGIMAEAEVLLSAARVAYDEGEMTLVEFLDATGAFRDARLSALTLRAEAWLAYYNLLRAMGASGEES
ncbi:MAG: TolC family protein [Gammaproteobacteria bacterium]|nr:TolC family protein [Gammaproteobacteria bacterium]